MKIFSIAAALATLILVACNKPQVAETAPTPTPEPAAPQVSAPPSITASAPQPAEVPITAATPAPRALMPEGIFTVLEKQSIETPDGIFGIKPGDSLKKTAPGVYLTSGHEVSLRDDQVTNDILTARAAMDADRAAQSSLVRPVSKPAATPSIAQSAPQPQQPTPPRPVATATTDQGTKVHMEAHNPKWYRDHPHGNQGN